MKIEKHRYRPKKTFIGQALLETRLKYFELFIVFLVFLVQELGYIYPFFIKDNQFFASKVTNTECTMWLSDCIPAITLDLHS